MNPSNPSNQLPPDDEPPRPGFKGLDPAELLARALNTVSPSADCPQWLPPEPEHLARLLPQYRIEGLLGCGGMGAVYKGTQVELDRPVAIKLLPVEVAADMGFVERFRREARTLAKLHHPGIVGVYDFGQTSEGHLYFVMEYIDGTDLRRILTGPGITSEQALEVTVQICEALQAAHLRGVIHRDIKPENILLTQDGQVKLADFGLSRMPEESTNRALTVTQTVMGTPDYMSPEQRQGQTDHRTDIFALGVMLYEMLTGNVPRGAFTPPSQKVQVDVRVDEVVLRALQEAPDRRYQKVSDMQTDVDRIRTGVPVEPSPSQQVPSNHSSRNRSLGLYAATLALFGIALFGGSMWLNSSKRATSNPVVIKSSDAVPTLSVAPSSITSTSASSAFTRFFPLKYSPIKDRIYEKPGKPEIVRKDLFHWTGFVGMPGGRGNADGVGKSARFCQPWGLAMGNSGTLYITDMRNHTIRKMTPDGRVTTIAGGEGCGYADSKDCRFARFARPTGIAIDAQENIYVADSANRVIRKIDPTGAVTTLAGNRRVSKTVDGTGVNAGFASPAGLCVDGNGNLYVADDADQVIRKIAPNGDVTTFAGAPGVSGAVNGTGKDSQFDTPEGIATDRYGNVYVADCGNHVIRKITPAGSVSTFAGQAGAAGYHDGFADQALFTAPDGVLVASNGDVYVADGTAVIRKVTATGEVKTVAGVGHNRGHADGTGAAAQFFLPLGMAFDANGDLIVADIRNYTLRKITTSGVVTTIAGLAANEGFMDGPAQTARLNEPSGLTIDAAGDLYVADWNNNAVRKIRPDGFTTTVAGSAKSGKNDGKGANAQFHNPGSVAAGFQNTLYVTDLNNHTIRKILPDGEVTTIAGSPGTAGSVDGIGNAARLREPTGIAVDRQSNIWFGADNAIRKITPTGEVTTVAGHAGLIGRVDGVGSGARFTGPIAMTFDLNGNLLAADGQNNCIRKITPSGNVTTVAGCGKRGLVDGPASEAQFNFPTGIATDSKGNIFVADTGNNVIRMISPDGMVATVGGGEPGTGSSEAQPGDDAKLNCPSGIVVDSRGRVFVCDTLNHRVEVGIPR